MESPNQKDIEKMRFNFYNFSKESLNKSYPNLMLEQSLINLLQISIEQLLSNSFANSIYQLFDNNIYEKYL